MKHMTVAERLELIRKELNITKTKLGELAGSTYPSQSITNWIKRDSISKDAAKKLSEATGYNLQWIFDGTGDAKNTNIRDGIPLDEINPKGVIEWDDNTLLIDEEVEVPFFKSIELAAGHGGFQEDDFNGFKLRFSKSFFRRKNVQKEFVVCFPARGNSMEPVIPHGATVAVDTAQKIIIDGDIYAICQDGLCRIKRLYALPNNKVRINSYNVAEHPDETAELSDIQIIGRVFHYAVEL